MRHDNRYGVLTAIGLTPCQEMSEGWHHNIIMAFR